MENKATTPEIEKAKEDFINQVVNGLQEYCVEDQLGILDGAKKRLQESLDVRRENLQEDLRLTNDKLFYLHNGHYNEPCVVETRSFNGRS